jgi:hypothetical protein
VDRLVAAALELGADGGFPGAGNAVDQEVFDTHFIFM